MSEIKNRFSSGKYECISLDDVIPQKCVLAFCDESSTMYIAFEGSGVLDDWLVNLNVKLESVANSGSQDFSPKVHTGFHERAKKWINDDEQIMEKIKEWKPKRIVTTGHSLGAATSSIAHILLVLSQVEETKDVEFQNMAFASPLFGNLDLKKAILKAPDQRLRNMYHFVNCDDIVPAVTIIEETYDNLSFSVGAIANNSKLLLNLLYLTGYVDIDEDQKAELVAKLDGLLVELDERKKMIDKPLFHNRGNDTYMPMGHFIFMKKKGSSQSLHVFDFEESIEKSEHQWICQILVKSLENLGKVKVIPFIPIKYDHILSNHNLEKNYFAQVTNCLSMGKHDNFMKWKSATDGGNSQEIQSPTQKNRRLEKMNSSPQKTRRLERMNSPR